MIDTLGLARGIYGTGGNALEKLCERLGVKRETAHRALGDAMMTANVLTLMARWYSRHKGIHTLAELAALSQDIRRTTGRGITDERRRESSAARDGGGGRQEDRHVDRIGVPPGWCFTLILASIGEGGYTTWISSIEREDTIRLLREMADKMERGPNV